MSDNDTTRHRLTPTERLHEVTMAALNGRRSTADYGCKIVRNAKGDTQFEVDVNGSNLLEVVVSATTSFVKLDQFFPFKGADERDHEALLRLIEEFAAALSANADELRAANPPDGNGT